MEGRYVRMDRLNCVAVVGNLGTLLVLVILESLGKMDSETAMSEDTQVTAHEAINEIGRHGHLAIHERDRGYITALLDDGRMEKVVDVDKEGMVRTVEVMGWLGY